MLKLQVSEDDKRYVPVPVMLLVATSRSVSTPEACRRIT